MFECVINISEGQNSDVLSTLDVAAGASLRDRHSDVAHNRSVYTLINFDESVRRDAFRLIERAVDSLDLRTHHGVHPRLGVVDVVPYVPLVATQMSRAIELREATAQWMATELNIPTFIYGPTLTNDRQSLPEIRKRAFVDLWPNFGPRVASPRSGASAVGARSILVAWNLWISSLSLSDAQRIARIIRSPSVRALGLNVSGYSQISCNLIDVTHTRPSEVYDTVQELLPRGSTIERAELVGLAPRSLLENEDSTRWDQLGLSPSFTIESTIGS